MGDLFQVIFVHPILNILVAIYDGLTFAHVPYSLGFSIILLTIVIRLVLYPFTASQLRASRKMQELTPHLNKLKEQHKKDAARLQKETMALYRQHGVNPVAGCLPVLIQLPVIWSLYFVLQHVVKYKLSEINSQVYSSSLRLHHLWDTGFFGLSLGHTPAQLMSQIGFAVFLIPLLTGLLQFIQTKMMFVKQPKNENKKPSEPDFAQAFQSQSLYVFPVMIGFFSYSFPLGLSLYWNTFTIFGIIQQYQLQGFGGLQDLLPGKKPKV